MTYVLIQILSKEIKLWSSLDHPNILCLLGYSFEDEISRLSFVSEWMENGTADKYVQARPNCNIGLLVSPKQNVLFKLDIDSFRFSESPKDWRISITKM